MDFNYKSFSTITVKSFDIWRSSNAIHQSKMDLVLTFYVANEAGNHKKSQLSCSTCLYILIMEQVLTV